MKSFHNIEKSAFHRNEYVGYSCGVVFRIVRDGRQWYAIAEGTGLRITCPTLALVSIALDNFIPVGV